MQSVFHALGFSYVLTCLCLYSSASNGKLITHSIFHLSPTLFAQIKTNRNCKGIWIPPWIECPEWISQTVGSVYTFCWQFSLKLKKMINYIHNIDYLWRGWNSIKPVLQCYLFLRLSFLSLLHAKYLHPVACNRKYKYWKEKVEAFFESLKVGGLEQWF
jgi:hypothetical protein